MRNLTVAGILVFGLLGFPYAAEYGRTTDRYEFRYLPNPKDDSRTDVYMSDKRTGKEKLINAPRNLSKLGNHLPEFHNGNIYVVRNMSTDPAIDTGPYELWCHPSTGNNIKLLSISEFDGFTISPDEQIISIIKHNDKSLPEKLLFFNMRASILKAFELPELGAYSISFTGWAEHLFWFIDRDGLLYEIDSDTFNFMKSPFNENLVEMGNVELEPKNNRIVFVDRPDQVFDGGPWGSLDKNAPVHLYVFDLRSGMKHLIDTSHGKRFNAVWISDMILEYDNPNGSGRVLKEIQ